MATEANLQTTATLSPDVPAQYLRDEMLERAMKSTVFWNLAEKATQPKGEGKVCQWVRYERLPLPVAPAEEGVTPSATPMTISMVQAVLDQWVAYVALSDQAELTIRHPVFQEAKDLLSLQHDETVDRECQVVLMGSSSVIYAGGQTARSSLTAADTLKSDDIRRIVAKLRNAGARPSKGSLYYGIIDPFVKADLSKDATFVAAGVSGSSDQLRTLREFDIGAWLGVWWTESNLIPTLTLLTDAYVEVAAATSTDIPSGATGFDAGSSVITKGTYLDPQTGFESTIGEEETVTDAAAFAVKFTISSSAPSGDYLMYSTMQGGATGTLTYQYRVRHTTGTASTFYLCKSGTPTTNQTRVVTPTGRVAPPTPPSGVGVHTSYVFGKGFFGATTLGSLETFVTGKGATDSDPASQRRKLSWKQNFKAVILNNDYGFRVESASDFS